MAPQFLQGATRHVYNQVFCPLAASLQSIESGRSRHVHLKTINETDSKTIRVQCSINGNAPLSCSTGDCSSWNCSILHVAPALTTATEAFSIRIPEMALEVELCNEIADIEKWQNEVIQIQSILQKALQTVGYVYKTYNSNASIDTHVDAGNPIGTQYLALQKLLEQEFTPLLETIETKLNSYSALIDDFEEIDGFEEIPVSRSAHDHARQMLTDESLVFADHPAASQWFYKKIQSCKVSNGEEVHSNLRNSVNWTKKAPEAFVSFAKSLDATFKDETACCGSVREICQFEEMKIILQIKALEITQPNTFEGLLTELCLKNADREVYQALLAILVNKEGTGPRGMGYQPALLNAMMNSSDYFSLFYSEHIVNMRI